MTYSDAVTFHHMPTQDEQFIITFPDDISRLVILLREKDRIRENKRVKELIINKLQEAMLLAEHLEDKDF